MHQLATFETDRSHQGLMTYHVVNHWVRLEKTMNSESPHVRVIRFGHRMHDGFRTIEQGSPWRRALAWLLAVSLAIPLIVLGVVVILTALAVAVTMGLIAWLTGGMTRRKNDPGGADAAGRENVRVIQGRN